MLRIALACFALTAALSAQGQTWVVDAAAGAGSNFSTLQAAVDAAQDGDRILVRPGSYGSTSIQGKDLVVVAERASGLEVRLGALQVSSIALGQQLVLTGFAIEGAQAGPTSGQLLAQDVALAVSDCGGEVYVEHCALRGAPGALPSQGAGLGLDGQPAARLTGAFSVQFERCELSGGDGALSTDACSGAGAPALDALDSRVALHTTTLSGGAGALHGSCPGASCAGTAAGAGVRLAGATTQAYLSSAHMQGGDAPHCGGASLSAPGLVVGGAHIDWIQSSAVGGAGAPDVDGLVVPKANSHRGLRLYSPLGAGHVGGFGFEGEPGDVALLFYALDSVGPFSLPGILGAQLLSQPILFGAFPVGASGESVVPFAAPPLGPGLPSFSVVLQPAFVDLTPPPGGFGLQVGALRSLVLLNAALSPTGFPDCNLNGTPDLVELTCGLAADCNQNGRPDACDIADGSSADQNADGVPDECQGG